MNDKLETIINGISTELYRDINDETQSRNYFVWNYADDRGGNFSDDAPTTNEVTVQLHWYVDKNMDFEQDKQIIRMRFLENGFTYPITAVTYEKDTKLRHIIFEAEISVEMED